MRNKSVAVLDIRSSEICAAVAEKGVNGTFIIKSKFVQPYDGYAERELLDVNGFVSALQKAVGALNSSLSAPLKQIFVGVPCEFTETVVTDRVVSFRSAQRITRRQVDYLIDNSAPSVGDGKSVIGYGVMYFVLSDKRKVLNPIGASSDSLRAKTCFFVCNDSFKDTVARALKGFVEAKDLKWVSRDFAEGLYLIDEDKRDGYSVLLDMGYISSTLSVISGNGIEYSEAFSIGTGHIAALLMEALEIPYDAALALIKKVNLNSFDRDGATLEVACNGEKYSYPSAKIKSLVREGFDGGVCEAVRACLRSFPAKDLTGAPIYVTGEGVNDIRGTAEYLSKQLEAPVETVAPRIPYYDKPQYASLFSLLNAALGGDTVK